MWSQRLAKRWCYSSYMMSKGGADTDQRLSLSRTQQERSAGPSCPQHHPQEEHASCWGRSHRDLGHTPSVQQTCAEVAELDPGVLLPR